MPPRPRNVLFATLLTVASAQACGTQTVAPAARSITAPPGTGSLTLSVSGEIPGSGHLLDRQTLYSGERLWLSVRTNRQANVYVAYCDSTQHLSVYPADGAISIAPGSAVRVPPQTEFRVDDNPGIETIFVVASLHTLDETDPALARVLRYAAAHGDKPPCARELTQSTDESRKAQGLPPIPVPARPTAKRKRQPTSPDPAAIPELPGIYRPRGLIIEDAPASEGSVEADSSGVAIIALKFSHEH